MFLEKGIILGTIFFL